jgi:hypothetical protein
MQAEANKKKEVQLQEKKGVAFASSNWPASSWLSGK